VLRVSTVELSITLNSAVKVYHCLYEIKIKHGATQETCIT